MSDIKIRDLRKKIGVSQEELSKMLGVHIRTVQNWEHGGVIPASKHALLRKMLEPSTHTPGASVGGANRKKIPLYDTYSVGGTSMIAPNDPVTAPTEWIDAGDWFIDATAAMHHYGDSMIEYPSGCILALKEINDKQLIIWGKNYVIETDEYRITKRLQRSKDPKYVIAYSTNEEKYQDGTLIHQPIDIPKSAIRRLALVLGYVVKEHCSARFYSINRG
jgi:toxin-antitoxin system, antitoxin component, xre family